MSEAETRVTVNPQQIAEIAGVRRSAVGNWRKRHQDFPVPDTRGGFDLGDVERWLIENEKIDRRVPAGFRAWSLADNLRSDLSSDEITQCLVAVFVYLHACEIASRRENLTKTSTSVKPSDSWNHVRKSDPRELTGVLRAAGARIERDNLHLDGLLVPGLEHASQLAPELLRSLIDSFESATDESNSRFSLFEEAVNREHIIDRFRGDYSTPRDVAQLMVQLAGDRAGVVCDLACGEGGLLMTAALREVQAASRDSRFAGIEINETALRMARSRFFLSGLEVDLRLENAFQIPLDALPVADLVLVDPPLGKNDWRDADVYLDDRWTFGKPSRRSADFAWLQLAIQCLAQNGRAVVLTTTRAAFASGPEAQIRRSMLKAGVVEAVIGLPDRTRTNISIPLVLWVLRPPSLDAGSVLFVDASMLGTTGRSKHAFDESDIDRLAALLRTREHGQPVDSEISWVVEIDRVIENGAVLEPRRYRPIVDVDIDVLRSRVELIRSGLVTSSEKAVAAVRRSSDWDVREAESTISLSNRALGDVATILGGDRLSRRNDSETGIPVFGIAEILADGTGRQKFVDPDALEKRDVILQAGDVVVSLANSVGASKLVTSHHEGAVLGRHCAVLRPSGSDPTSAWIYIWTQSTQFKEQVLRHTAGSTLPRLSYRVLQELLIPVPPLEDQLLAEALLREMDNAIARVDEMQAQLTELREIRLDLFVADLKEAP